MRASSPLSLLAALLLCLSSGCCTAAGIVNNDLHPYSGVRTDGAFLAMGKGGRWTLTWPQLIAAKTLASLDLPLSFVCDTALLPYTIWKGWGSV